MKATPFNPETGQFLGLVIEGDARSIADNTPAGWSAASGEFAAKLQRVDRVLVDDFGAEVPIVVDQIPPRPEDCEWRTWSWDELTRQWVPVWTIKGRAELKRAERDRLLQSTDWVRLRAEEQGSELPAEWLAWRQLLRDAPLDPAWPDVTFPPPPPA